MVRNVRRFSTRIFYDPRAGIELKEASRRVIRGLIRNDSPLPEIDGSMEVQVEGDRLPTHWLTFARGGVRARIPPRIRSAYEEMTCYPQYRCE